MKKIIIELDSEIKKKISDLGYLWNKSPLNHKPTQSHLDSWESVIKEWINDKNFPLVIRKGPNPRGSVVIHSTGRRIIVADNSFSQWIYYHIIKGEIFSLRELKEKLRNDEIPFSFVIKAKDRPFVKYSKTIGEHSTGKLGWKLCHKEPVGINKRKKIEDIPIEQLENHFYKLANPKNMFVLPLQIGGIGEVQEFIVEQI